uniref:Uncharacterized protein n=1 Tax=Pararge aegeria TaxID=116150 RepID=S4NMS6_9NEOP
MIVYYKILQSNACFHPIWSQTIFALDCLVIIIFLIWQPCIWEHFRLGSSSFLLHLTGSAERLLHATGYDKISFLPWLAIPPVC